MTQRGKYKLAGAVLAVLTLAGVFLLLRPVTMETSTDDFGAITVHCPTGPGGPRYDKAGDDITGDLDDPPYPDCSGATMQKRQWLFLPTALLGAAIVLLIAPIGRDEILV